MLNCHTGFLWCSKDLNTGVISGPYVFFSPLQQCREGQDVLPEQIKAVLLDSAGFQNMIWLGFRTRHINMEIELPLTLVVLPILNFRIEGLFLKQEYQDSRFRVLHHMMFSGDFFTCDVICYANYWTLEAIYKWHFFLNLRKHVSILSVLDVTGPWTISNYHGVGSIPSFSLPF